MLKESGQEVNSIAKLRASQIKALVDWQSESEFFVPLRASVRAFMSEDFPLEDDIDSFLLSDKKVMLLLGDSGSGKSLYTQGLVAKKWQSFSPQKCIPLWISLPSLKNPTERAIEETLEKAGLAATEIDQLRQENQFLFIFDGYDEIRQIKNLYVSNHLENWQAKVIITCRREYLYHIDHYALHFTPFIKERAVHASYMERVIKPVNAEQIDRYLQQFVARGGTAWPDWQRYRAGIDEIPGLSHLLSSPFMLKLAMSVLPTLLERYQGKGDLRIQITQAAIYDAFIEQWFERQQAKLKNSGEISEEEELKPAFWGYAKALAQAMHEAKITVVNYETESNLFDDEINPWARFFAPEDKRVALLQTACLVREISPKHYAFVHGSLLSYFMSRHLYENLLIDGLAENEASKVVDSNQEAVPVKFSQVKSEPQKSADEQSYFNQCLLVRDSETIQFSADKICDGTEGAALKKRYFSLIDASKNNLTMCVAAANSITILNRARINFSGMDLSEINIPMANLEGGLFHYTNFRGSNLSGVNLSKAYLVNAQLRGANLTDVDLGEWPYLSMPWLVNAIGYSPDGKLLAIAVANNIEIWDAAKESLLLKCTGHTDVVTSIAFTTDDQYLLSGSKDKTLRLWSLETGKLICIMEGHESEVTAVACHREGKRWASASKDGNVRQWSSDTFKAININKRHSGEVTCVAYSPNGKYLASAGGDKIVRQWSVETGKLFSISTQHTDKITSLAYSPDNRFLASGSANELCTWLVQSGELVHKESVLLLGGITCLNFSPDSQFLASGSGNGSVNQWSTTSGKVQAVHNGFSYPITSIVYNPNGQKLLASAFAWVRQWSTEISQSTLASNASGNQRGMLWKLAYSNNDQKLISSTRHGHGDVSRWSVDDGSLLSRIGRIGDVGIALSPDGQRVAMGNTDGSISQWLLEGEGKLLTESKGHTNTAQRIAYSQDGERFASASLDGTVRQWSTETGKCLTKSSVYAEMSSVVYSQDNADGAHLLARSKDGTIYRWAVETGDLLCTYKSGYEGHYNVAVSPNGATLAFPTKGTVIGQWSVKTRGIISEHYIIFPSCVEYSPDGRYLIAGGSMGEVCIWNVSDDNEAVEVATLYSSTQTITCMAVTVQNDIIVGTIGGEIKYWRYDSTQNKPTWLLKWSSDRQSRELLAMNCNIENVVGLSKQNRLLLSRFGIYGTGVNESEENLFREILSEVVNRSNKGVVRELLISGHDINYTASHGYTPINLAVYNQNYLMVKELLIWKPDLTIRDPEGYTPLVRAISIGNEKIAVELLVAGAKIDEIHADGYLPFHMACKFGHEEIIKLLLAHGADINGKTPAGWTPLHIAADNGKENVIKLLLVNGADQTLKNELNETPAEVAVRKRHQAVMALFPLSSREEEVSKSAINQLQKFSNQSSYLIDATLAGNLALVESLLQGGAEVDATNKEGFTALHVCAYRGHKAIAELLLAHGAKVEIKGGNDSRTPLISAADGGYKDLVDLLLDNGAEINTTDKDGGTPLHWVACKGHHETLLLLVTRGAEINVRANNGVIPLHKAAENGDKKGLETLLTHGAGMNAEDDNGWRALHYAASGGQIEVIEILLAQGAEIEAKTKDGMTALLWAGDKSRKQAIELLLSRGANMCAKANDGTSLFQYSIYSGYKDIVEKLLDHGAADVNTTINCGRMPLHIAAVAGRSDMVGILLKKGADLKAVDNEGMTALHCAALNGHIEMIEVLLSHSAEVNAKTNNGCTALHVAAMKDGPEVVRVLLTNGGTVNAQNNEGETPMHCAAREGLKVIVEVLLSQGADINAEDENGYRALHCAADAGKTDAIEILLAQGAEIEAKTKDGSTALHCAGIYSKREAIELLLNRGADMYTKNNNGWSLFQHAINAGYKDIVEKFLDQGAADVYTKTNDGMMPLHIAARVSHRDMIEMFLKKGAEINVIDAQYGQTALHYAAQYGQAEIIEVLLSHGAEINAKKNNGGTALHVAAWNDHIEVSRVLLAHGGVINAQDNTGETPLHWAAQKGFKEIVEFLLSHEADIEAKDNNGTTPLHAAASAGHSEVIEVLLSHGAEINAKKNNGGTALHVAAWNDHIEVIRVLLTHGGIVNAQSNSGETPLHWAARKGSKVIVEFLLSNKADVEAIDNEGGTPLHFAIWNDHKELVEILLMHNAAVSALTKIGRTSLHFAAQKGNKEIIALLLERGADIKAKDYDETTMLHHASLGGQDELAKILLVYGDLESPNVKGRRPLHLAAREGHEKVVRLFLDNNANFNAQDTEFGNTPLHWAAQNGHGPVVKILVEQGADPEIKNTAGMTAQQIAIEHGQQSVIDVLRQWKQSSEVQENLQVPVIRSPVMTIAKTVFFKLTKASLPEEIIQVNKPAPPEIDATEEAPRDVIIPIPEANGF